MYKSPIDFTPRLWYNVFRTNVWVWRRLVARYLGVVEAAGSTPVTQTKIEALFLA